MGLEPTALGTTNRCSNQLSYSHRFNFEVANLAFFKNQQGFFSEE